MFGAGDGFAPVGEGVADGAFFAPTLLLCRDALEQRRGARRRGLRPGQHADAVRRLRRGAGARRARPRQPGRARWSRTTRRSRRRRSRRWRRWHGRLLVLDREAAAESTGHGSPLPMLKHGGPGRAGGGEELGGIRAVKHYLQRAAVQGSPTMLTAVTGEYVRGAALNEGDVHPFRKHFEELRDRRLAADAPAHRERGRHRRLRRHLGRLLLHALRRDRGQGVARSASASRTATSCCRRRRACSSRRRRGRCSPTTASTRCASSSRWRSATRSARASPASARSTATRRTRKGAGQGVVAWDVEVTNQDGELVASYDILTLVAKRGRCADQAARG